MAKPEPRGRYEDVSDALEDSTNKAVHHLADEERDAVPLIHETMTAREMSEVGHRQARRLGCAAPRSS